MGQRSRVGLSWTPQTLVGIRELARHLDVSIGTVSRALNDRADVNPLTRQRVREAAARLGYSPNQSGRSLRRGRTDLIGMLVPGNPDNTLINTVFLSVLDGLKRRLGERGLDLAIFLEGGSDDRLGALRRVSERGLADALIIADIEGFDRRVEYLMKLGKPFVAFGRTRGSERHAWVDADFEAAVEGAVERLVALGHRRIGLALPRLRTNYLDLVETGYRRAMRAHGLTVGRQWDVRYPAGERGGLEAADALLAADPRPTAILVNNSMQTVAIYRRFGEAGLRPGRDISILGLLPEARAQYLIPTLTTYQTDWTEVGRRLADAVIAEIAAAPEREPEEGHPRCSLRRGCSSRCPSHSAPERAFTASTARADRAGPGFERSRWPVSLAHSVLLWCAGRIGEKGWIMVAARRMQSFKLTQFGAPLAEVIEVSAGPVGRPDAASRSRVRRVSLRRPSRRRLFRPRSRAEDRRLRRRPAAARPRSRNRRRRRGSGTGGQRRPCRRPPRCLCVGRLRRLRALPNRPGEPLRPAEEHRHSARRGLQQLHPGR